MAKCLYCYKNLESGDFHEACAKKIFLSAQVPILPFSIHEIEKLAKTTLSRSIAVPGVQAKLSLDIENKKEEPNLHQKRFTIVGLWGNFILKPPTPSYPFMSEVEHCTMMLAKAFKIPTVPHSLIRLQSEELCYITRRIDRKAPLNPYQKGSPKIHMEDFCQLSGKLTEQKYKGSLEAAGKIIKAYSANAGFDILVFFELIVFCFLTGNADMHLKNFSLIEKTQGQIVFAPAYDLLNTRLFISEKEDSEETALTLNGKKRKLKLNDFTALARNLGLSSKQTEIIFNRLTKNLKRTEPIIRASFMPEHMQDAYLELCFERAKRLEI